MPHEDGAAYAPVVATVSLGDSIVLDIYDKSKKTGDVNGNKETGSGSKLVARPFQEISDNKTDSSDVKANGHEDRSDALKPVARIFQEPGSLLVTTGAAYTSLLHGISPVPYDVNLGPSNVANWDSLSEKTRDGITQHNGTHIRGVRTSLTYRDVLKVRKIGIGVVGRR